MEKIKILHVGDIHYPDNKERHEGDIKDGGISQDFIKDILPNCFNKMSIQIIQAIKHNNIDSVLFSGDLTSRGDLDGYNLCVQYFTGLLSKESIGKDIDIHVVPGNHDVNRLDSERKFNVFSDVWKSLGRDILEPYDVRSSLIQKTNSRVRISSLNTCVGCGEFRGFPAKIKEKIISLFERANLENKDDFDVFGESLDTPAANQEDISKIQLIIENCKEENSVPLILGHHGLLPQAVVRADIYTEMINGGYLRSILNSSEYPIIYCHGHIHDDPVEIIMQPQYQESMLISISAPAFVDGFNIIEFDFSENGFPLGCIIKTFKIKNYSGLKMEREIRIPLRKPGPLEKYCDSKLENVYASIPNELIFYRDLIKNNFTFGIGDGFQKALLELEWLGLVGIENREKSEKNWIVRRIGV